MKLLSGRIAEQCLRRENALASVMAFLECRELNAESPEHEVAESPG